MKIINCIFCDDIRMESDGRSSLMGVFGKTIILPAPPDSEELITKRLGVFITVMFDETDQNKNLDHIKFFLKNGKTSLLIGEGELPPDDDRMGKELTLTSVMSQFPVDVDEELNVVIEYFDKSRELIESFSPEIPIKFKKQAAVKPSVNSKN